MCSSRVWEEILQIVVDVFRVSGCPFLPRSDVCMPLAERMRLDARRVKAELVELPVARELHKEGQKIHENTLSQ